MKRKHCIFLLFFMVTGCAINRRVSYHHLIANFTEISNKNISIAVWDQREQVRSGNRKRNFVGYMRTAIGIAYPMGTFSGRPLADDITRSIVRSFQNKGCTVEVIATSNSYTQEQILENFKKSGSAKFILIKMNQYHTDGYGAQSLHYNLQVGVYDRKGNLIKEKNYIDERKIGGSAFWGPRRYKKYMPEAFKKLMEKIFSDIEITSALASS